MRTRKFVVRTAAMLSLLLSAACQSPLLVFPGGELRGTPASTDSFVFAEDFNTLQLEVNSTDPYSVILRTTVIDGELYVDAARARRWASYLASDPNVRVKLGDYLYRAVAEVVEDASITGKFLPGRTIYRIRPVSNGPGN